MKRFLLLFALLAFLLCACQAGPSAPPISVQSIQTGTAQATQTLEPPAAQPTLQEEVPLQVVNALEYMPQLFSAITTQSSTGGGQTVSTTLVYGLLPSDQYPDYLMTGFDEQQPFFFTDYFLGGEGVFTRFSDSPSEELAFVMPLELYPGLCFGGEDGPCEVAGVDVCVQAGSYVFEDALLIAIDSVTYGKQVFAVYQRGVGETARFIQYSPTQVEMLSVVTDVEIWDESQVNALIDSTVF